MPKAEQGVSTARVLRKRTTVLVGQATQNSNTSLRTSRQPTQQASFPIPLDYAASSSNAGSSQVYWERTDDLGQIIQNFDGPDCVNPGISRAESQASTVVNSFSSLSSLGKRKAVEATSDGLALCEASPKRVKTPNQSDPFLANYTEICGQGSDGIEPFIIAHNNTLQSILDARKISTGVQWELARLVSMELLSYDAFDVLKLDELKGSNAEAAPKVAKVFFSAASETIEQSQFAKAFAREMSVHSPWVELDKEETVLSSDPLGALGHNDTWYGGKIQFIGKVKDVGTKDQPNYRIVLERPSLGPSNRFARRFGSKRFLRIHIAKNLLHKRDHKLVAFFSRPFIINGRVFRSFFAKENNAFLIETNESYKSDQITSSDASPDTDGRMSILDFLNFHNPLSVKKNRSQAMAKWVSRFALGLSNSVPGPKLEVSNIIPEPDIISPSFHGPGKAPSEVEMTDGCGLANANLLRQLREKLEWENFPTAVQCRIGGAKGLILLHPSGRYDDSTEPKVWIRPSQTKIRYSQDTHVDPANLGVDVLRPSHLKYPARLSAETIINLAENGVHYEVFIKLMKDGLNELVGGLLDWDGDHAMATLWYKVARVGGVMNARMARELAGESRARGFGARDDVEDDDDDEDAITVDTAMFERSTAWWSDQISGCPSSLEETVMVLLDSGFTPKDCPVLADKLKQVLNTAINRYITRYKIDVPMSCGAFVVPDPFGVLEPGEIHIKSTRQLKSQDGLDTDMVIGDVLVTRHPCKVPTDVQKVKAVHHNALRQCVDVIVFSTKGDRSLASMLGGGDYDGDKVTAIWQPEIVSRFKNADKKFADPPADLQKCFSRNNETVSDFLSRVEPIDTPSNRIREFQKFLLGALDGASAVGTYSNYHDLAVFKLGYGHPETVRLAYMFCTCLDGSKTGLTLSIDAINADRKLYGGRQPKWKETPEDDERFRKSGYNECYPKRAETHPTFIMDRIKEVGSREGDGHQLTFKDKTKDNTGENLDQQLAEPWTSAQDRAHRLFETTRIGIMGEDLVKIAEHVHRVRTDHRERLNTVGTPKKGAKGAGFTSLTIEKRQDILRALSREFHSHPPGLSGMFFSEQEIRRVKASYAYLHDWEMQKGKLRRWTRFPWDVAMRDLCEIKVKALGPSKTIMTMFYEVMTVHGYIKG